MYDYACDWKSGFVMDPLKKQRVGYLVDFEGIGIESGEKGIQKDVIVYCPYNGEKPKFTAVEPADKDGGGSGMLKVTVVGVIEHFSWGGGVGDPICISAYVSTETANQIQVKQQTTLKTTMIKKLSWWIVNYDEEEKKWFEEAHPIAKDMKDAILSGQLNAPGKTDIRLAVAKEPTKVAPNIDVNVYNVYFEVVPAANQTHDLKFAASASKPFVKGWGLRVGNQAATAMGTK